RVRRTVPIPAHNAPSPPSNGDRAVDYGNTETHWWDGSQIYGSCQETQNRVRAFKDGKLKLEANGRLPADPDVEGLDLTGFNENWWFGLSCLHTLFTKEHNAICDVLKRENPGWDDQRLFDTAWLINSALMAKIHTVEWTPGIVNTPALWFAMNVNWSGIFGQTLKDRFGRLGNSEIFSGIMASMGVEHPGQITLHNYPRALQRFRRIDGELMDLATLDILRDRERGVPRYNAFREELRMPRIRSFDELTPNKRWAEEMRRVYNNDIDKVDLQVGMYAEPLPPGFGFSDTAFRVFILMASRRLKSDRFFTTDFRPEVYTETGIKWVTHTKMKDVLLRHYPELEPALEGLPNAFLPWNKVSPDGKRVTPLQHRAEGVKKALAAINA